MQMGHRSVNFLHMWWWFETQTRDTKKFAHYLSQYHRFHLGMSCAQSFVRILCCVFCRQKILADVVDARSLGLAYLGLLLVGDPDHEKEFCRRIEMGWSAYGKHYEILTASLPLSFKRKVQSFTFYRC